MAPRAALLFRSVYQTLVWGGRRLERFRGDLPPGPVGEAWDIADHPRGQSVVERGPDEGRTLRELCERHGPALVGAGYDGGEFPLLVKLIDAADRLSVQVHPDDEGARLAGLGPRGKTECWLALADGGELWQGTRPGVDRAAFEGALAAGRLADALNRYEVRAGDFFFLEARTVHALGAGCLVYELQQTCDVTFRVHDWGRVGLDGRPRPLHLAESLATIDFARSGFGPRPTPFGPRAGAEVRVLATCAHFELEEWRVGAGQVAIPAAGACALVTCLDGALHLGTDAGSVTMEPLRTALVPAAAGGFRVQAAGAARFALARPVLSAA